MLFPAEALVEDRALEMRTADFHIENVPGNLRDDWRTYHGDLFAPGLWVMLAYRFGRWRYRIRPRWIRMGFSFAYKVLFALVRAASGAEVPCEARIGRGLRIDHSHGIVISGDAWLGDDVILRNGVTIGLRRRQLRGSPVIGHRVDIGAGAKILGTIRVGDDVSIGANAVVLIDVPANSIAVGVPARVSAKKGVEDQTPEWLAARESLL
jgi:serine O-acetyltransferase